MWKVEGAFRTQGGKGGEETVLLLAFVIDAEVLGVIEAAPTLAERVGNEAVVVLADIAQK